MTRIEVWSDVVCPWCWIGKRRLAKALQGRTDVEVVWQPFQLNPGFPPEGMDRTAYRTSKFGSLQRSKELEANVAEVGRGEGLAFAFDKIRRTPNTFDAHRVLRRARREGLQDEVGEALFRGYFAEGLDLGDRAQLAAIARGAGLELDGLLETDAEAEEVRAAETEGRALGIQGVPFFVINRAVGLSGAQPPEVLREALAAAAKHPG